MYDVDHDGFISKAELTQVLVSLQKITGTLVTHSGKTLTPDQFVSEFFSSVGDENGRMSLAAYKEGALKNPDIFECLRLNSVGLCTDPLKTRPNAK